jgi:hypothetical protein
MNKRATEINLLLTKAETNVGVLAVLCCRPDSVQYNLCSRTQPFNHPSKQSQPLNTYLELQSGHKVSIRENVPSPAFVV